MRVFVLLVLLSGSECVVVGRSGENVTLACSYDIKYHGSRPVCWGRGNIPLSGCGSALVSTDGRQVSGGGGRFLLLGRLQDGDVSLTILNLTEADAGRYGCRVDVAGWFNGDRHHFDLTVEAARSVVSDSSDVAGTSELPTDGTLNAPRTTTNEPRGGTAETGSDVTGPAVQVNSLQSFFIGNTLRVSFIIFIPALLLLSAAYRVWSTNQRTKADGQLNQSEEEEEEERGGRGGRGRGGGRGGRGASV